jgi:hypothetical protein
MQLSLQSRTLIVFQNERQSRIRSRSPERRPAHEDSFYGVVQCKECHGAKCFLHHLTHNNFHAKNIILQLKYRHKDHHQAHQYARSHYVSNLQSFLRKEELGSQPDSDIQSVNLALSFGTCKPFNPEFLCLGWYDTNFVSLQVTSIEHFPDFR